MLIIGTRVVQLAFAGVPNDIKLRAHTGNNVLHFRPIQRDLVLLRALDVTKDGDDVIHVVLNCTTLDVNVSRSRSYLCVTGGGGGGGGGEWQMGSWS